MPYLRRNVREALLRDLYYHLAAARWPALLGVLFIIFIAINLLFASAYFLDHGLKSLRATDFAEAFLFSIHYRGEDVRFGVRFREARRITFEANRSG